MGLPPGVVNIVTGDGPGAGAPLVAHPAVRKIAFTGSAEVGKTIMRNAADQLKRVSLELGGKSPNIFFSDADFENAVDGALFGTFINQGEVCSAGSRVLVQRDIYKKFVDAAAAKAKTIKLGPGMDRDNKMGPLVSAEQRDRVADYLEVGRGEAKVAVGGGRPKQFDKGWYIEPTIFYDVDNSARIAQEEIFGPVMSVIPFNDEAEAHPDRQRDTLRPGGRGLDPGHLQGVPGGEGARGRHRLGQPHAADLRRGALGRLQGLGLWPGAGALGRGGIPGDQAGIHQSRREADRLVLTYTVLALTNSLIP